MAVNYPKGTKIMKGKKFKNNYSSAEETFGTNMLLPQADDWKKLKHKCVSEGVLCDHSAHFTSPHL